ncbi:hypothetical protein V8F20_000945 [Naviculisporaceae sp. PSN 640]
MIKMKQWMMGRCIDGRELYCLFILCVLAAGCYLAARLVLLSWSAFSVYFLFFSIFLFFLSSSFVWDGCFGSGRFQHFPFYFALPYFDLTTCNYRQKTQHPGNNKPEAKKQPGHSGCKRREGYWSFKRVFLLSYHVIIQLFSSSHSFFRISHIFL